MHIMKLLEIYLGEALQLYNSIIIIHYYTPTI